MFLEFLFEVVEAEVEGALMVCEGLLPLMTRLAVHLSWPSTALGCVRAVVLLRTTPS